MWKCTEPITYYEKPREDSKALNLKPQTVISNLNVRGYIHIWYPKDGWIRIGDSMNMIYKCVTFEQKALSRNF